MAGKNLILSAAGKTAGKAAPALAAVEASKGFFEAWFDYKKVREVEETKRESIRAQRDVAIAKIKAEKEILEKYLEQSFAERRYTIEETFKRFDSALESNNLELASQAMQSIVCIVKESPLKQINKLIDMTNDPTVDEIEIWSYM